MEKNKAIVLYVPVVHQGYVDFLNLFADEQTIVYLLDGESLAVSFPDINYLIRDLRAVDTNFIKASLQLMFKKIEFRSLSGKYISLPIQTAMAGAVEIIMPNDDVSDVLLSKVPGLLSKTTLLPFSLRWDKNQTLLQKEIDVDTIHFDDFPKNVFEALKKQVNKSVDWWRQVGCVIYNDYGDILLASYNKHYPNDLSLNIFGDPRFNFKPGEHIEYCSAIHSEAWAIARAAKEGIALKRFNILVSDFPCPTCAKLLSETGIKNLTFVQGYSVVDGKETLESKGVTIKKLIFE